MWDYRLRPCASAITTAPTTTKTMTTASASKDHALKNSSMADLHQSSQIMLTHQEDGPMRHIASACACAANRALLLRQGGCIADRDVAPCLSVRIRKRSMVRRSSESRIASNLGPAG